MLWTTNPHFLAIFIKLFPKHIERSRSSIAQGSAIHIRAAMLKSMKITHYHVSVDSTLDPLQIDVLKKTIQVHDSFLSLLQWNTSLTSMTSTMIHIQIQWLLWRNHRWPHSSCSREPRKRAHCYLGEAHGQLGCDERRLSRSAAAPDGAHRPMACFSPAKAMIIEGVLHLARESKYLLQFSERNTASKHENVGELYKSRQQRCRAFDRQLLLTGICYLQFALKAMIMSGSWISPAFVQQNKRPKQYKTNIWWCSGCQKWK